MANRRIKKAKVVIFSTVHRATDDRIFHKEALSLARAGYNVVVLAQHSREESISGVHIKPLQTSSSRLKRMLCATRVVAELVRENGDIYHFHDPELIPGGLFLRAIGKKVIYDSHEDLPKDILLKPYLPPWTRGIVSRAATLFERVAARLLSAVILPSEQYSPHIGERVAVHNYPVLDYIVSAAEQEERTAPGIPVVVYCGTITWMRGAGEMLRSVAIACKKVPVRLRLIGSVEDERLRSEIASHERSGAVEYLGEIPRRKVYARCLGAAAGLLLYHPAPFHRFIRPIRLFELMACGVPLIASDLPFSRKIVHDQGCGIVVDPLNISQIADAIIYLLKHPRKRRKWGGGERNSPKKNTTGNRSQRSSSCFMNGCCANVREPTAAPSCPRWIEGFGWDEPSSLFEAVRGFPPTAVPRPTRHLFRGPTNKKDVASQ